MTPDERPEDWRTWYTANRPRLEGSADVMRQLAFLLKALDGVFELLQAQRARERDANIVVPRLVGRL